MICNICGVELNSENWYQFDQKKHNVCKECRRKQCRESYHKNPEKRLAVCKKHYLNNREEIRKRCKENNRKLKMKALIYYGGNPPICACCGEAHIEFLTIDHINGGGNQHRKLIGNSSTNFYHWLENNNYPEGFRVLCWNCNCSKGIFGYCPHNAK